MSKTFEQNAGKALMMVAGIKKHPDEATALGIKAETLDALNLKAEKAIEMIREVDALRAVVSEKLQNANSCLAEVKEEAQLIRQLIKSNYPLERWCDFGIMDKR